MQRVLGRLVVQTAEWKDTEVRIKIKYTDGAGEHVYQKSVPASAAEAAALEQALQHYDERRTEVAPGLVQKVLEDVGLYDAHYEELRGSPENAEHFRKLEALVAAHAKTPPSLVVDGVAVVVRSIDDAARLVPAPMGAPVSTDPGYILFAQLEASAGSIRVYGLVAELVRSSGIPGAVVLCGGVKGLARIVFKTLTKYGGDYAKCRDLVRCTVQVEDVRGVVAVLGLVLESTDFVVVRIKNRFARG